MVTRQNIKKFILSNYLFTDNDSVLNDGESLMKKGVVDSTGMLELIAHLEETYSIMVAEEEMLPANLDSIDSIVAYVDRKRAG